MDAASVVSKWRDHVGRAPHAAFLHLALPHDTRVISRCEAWAQACACAARLRASGCDAGDVVLIFLPQSWEAIGYFLGAMLAGCAPSFMPCPSAKQDPAVYWASHARLLRRIAPSTVVTDAAHAAQMDAVSLLDGLSTRLIESGALAETPGDWTPAMPVSDAVALLQHSSGTTGLKKGVMLSHRAILAQVAAYTAAIDASESDVVVSWLPLYHDMGLIACLIQPLVLGQSIVLLDPFHWVTHPATLLEAIAAHGGTLCWLPNFAFEHLARTVRPDPATMDLKTMRLFINCSEICQGESFRRFETAFGALGVCPEMMSVCWAMAETTFAVTQTAIGARPSALRVSEAALRRSERAAVARRGETARELISCGVPIAGARVFAADADGAPLADDRVGELCVAADFLFDGYFRQEDETAQRLGGGVYRTRDRGFVYDGEIYVLGRVDDLLIINGRNFHAAEIEATLNDVAGLKPGRNVAFTIYSDATAANELILVAETAELNPQALRSSVRQTTFDTLGFYPARVVFVEPGWLVKTTSGKIARGANAAKYIQERGERP